MVTALVLVCDKAFIDKGSLVKHEYMRSGERPYVCDVCNKASSLKCHLVTTRA